LREDPRSTHWSEISSIWHALCLVAMTRATGSVAGRGTLLRVRLRIYSFQMVDVHSSVQRRHNMSSIRAKDTKPEMVVRRLLHGVGYRYVLHRRDLPGSPDIVFSRRRRIIFVNGCFWHSHGCRAGRVQPRTNEDFWRTKRSGTVARDLRNCDELRLQKWRVETVWECELADSNVLLAKLVAFLGPASHARTGED
jgi:DNA mismatch endonuclease (patch repair protein)